MNNGKNGAIGRFERRTLTTLLLISASAIMLACSQETPAPVPLAAQQPSTSVDVEATGSRDTTGSTISSTHARQGPSSGSVSFASSTNTTSMAAGSFGSFNLSPAPQTMPDNAPPSRGELTVSAVGSATRLADEAYVVMIPEMRYGPSGPEQLSEDDRDDIVEKLGEIDIAETDIEFDFRGRYGETTISVAVDVTEIEDRSDAIVEAVEEVVRRFDSHGLRFALYESSCEQALSEARREAVPAAEDTADDLAEALDVQRGAVIGAVEDRSDSFQGYYIPTTSEHDPCATSSSAPFYQLLPFDAEPMVRVWVGLQVTYAINAATAW